MGNPHHPRRGSLQIWPRKRAKRPYARIRTWPQLDGTKLLGFMGYKAGMTHLITMDNYPHSLTKGQEISIPVTVIECPPIKIFSLRFYKKTTTGLQLISEVLSSKIDKELQRKIKVPKKTQKEPESFDEMRVAVYTQPKLTRTGKKKPELFEVGISGNPQERLQYAKTLLDKDIKISDIFKEGQHIDAHSVTIGKGFQGTVKRYGVPIRQHKAEKTKRGIATLGSWTPKRVQFSVAQPGKMGYHLRTDYNKLIIKISDKPSEINPKGGFLHYGLIKNDYILLKGSIPGPVKRAITLTEPIRPNKKISLQQYETTYTSLESKQ